MLYLLVLFTPFYPHPSFLPSPSSPFSLFLSLYLFLLSLPLPSLPSSPLPSLLCPFLFPFYSLSHLCLILFLSLKGSFGGRSSDMRGVELLPESLLSPSKGIPEDDEVPLPPIPPRTAPSYCRKTSLPGKLDHSVSPKFLSSQKKPGLHVHDQPSPLHDPQSLPLQLTYSSPSPAIGNPQRSMSESKPHPSNPPPLPSRSVSFGATVNSRISNTSRSPLSASPVHREPGELSQSPEGEERSLDSYHDKALFTSTPLDATIGPSTYVISVEPDPLKQFPWYWGGPMTL